MTLRPVTLLSFTLLASALSGCQSTLSLPPIAKAATSQVSNQNSFGQQTLSQAQLTAAIKNTLYHNQDWVAEHQLYFVTMPKTDAQQTDEADIAASSDAAITACQNEHDQTLVKQMTQDNITEYAEVADLSKDQQQAYQRIKTSYLTCYNTAIAAAEQAAKNAADDEDNKPESAEKNYLVDSLEQLDKNQASNNAQNSQVSDDNDTSEGETFNKMLTEFGLTDSQVRNLNRFISQSGKLTVTGNYRPRAGIIATQWDMGFENKNLKYHYRLPIVANWHQQAVYVKPDIIMPMVALYLDNQLGMSWQDKWYRFTMSGSLSGSNSNSNSDSGNSNGNGSFIGTQLPPKVTSKAWLNAIKDSFMALPASQFRPIERATLLQNAPEIRLANQPLIADGNIIVWEQTAKEQDNFYQDITEHFIQNMDNHMASVKDAEQQALWQKYKQKLSQHQEKRLANTPNENQRLTGQSLYFVLKNNQIKQLFAKNTANIKQPIKINTWVTFSPDNRLLPVNNQPATLEKLTTTIHDTLPDGAITISQADEQSIDKVAASKIATAKTATGNVIDGMTEIKRIYELDSSRRLFGKDPEWFTLLKDYYEKAKDVRTDANTDNEDSQAQTDSEDDSDSQADAECTDISSQKQLETPETTPLIVEETTVTGEKTAIPDNTETKKIKSCTPQETTAPMTTPTAQEEPLQEKQILEKQRY